MRDDPDVTRRAVLRRTGGVAAVAALPGCTGPAARRPTGTETMPARLSVEPVDPPTPTDGAAADPIEYASLPAAERSLVDRAFETDEYVVDTAETPPAWDSFRARVEARSDDGGELVVYLVRDGRYYRVGMVNGDNVIADPSVPPSSTATTSSRTRPRRPERERPHST